MQTRRTILQGISAGIAAALAPARAWAQSNPLHTKVIPSTGERLPLVGLGSWITFNVGNDRELQDECAAVMAAFFQSGGRLINSSPMYGSSQPTIGYGLKKLSYPQALFSADKVGSRIPQAVRIRSNARAVSGAFRASISCKCTTCCPGSGTSRRSSP